MGLFPAKMLETTIISPIDDFKKLVVKIAETEDLMIKENISLKNLEDYYPSSWMEKLRLLESGYKDLISLIPEPKEKMTQKITRAFTKQKPIDPLFENWEDLENIEKKLGEKINHLKNEIKNLRDQTKNLQETKEYNELLAKGYRLLEIERPYDVNSDERALVGILTTSKIEDAEAFVFPLKVNQVIPLIKDKYFIYAKGKKGEISKLIKELSVIRWRSHEYDETTILNKIEIEEELLASNKDICSELNKVELDLKQFAIKNREIIIAIKLSIESFGHFLRIYVSAKKTKTTIIFQGWVAEKELNRVQAAIEEFPEVIFLYSEPPDEVKNIPVVEAKNPITKSFQNIVGLYGLPSAREVDPTIFFVFTFSIFFGIMFGDLGHGIVFVIIGLIGILARGLKKSVRQMFILVLSLGIASSVMGFIFGEAFGFQLTDLFMPEKIFGLDYPFLSPVHDLVDIFNLTLIIGALHITLGLILKIINQIRRREFAEILEETTSKVFLYAAILYFLANLGILDLGIDPSNYGFLLIGLVSLAIGVGLALFGQGIVSILFKRRRKNILRNFLSGIGMGLIHLLEAFSSFISNTISYGRMLAMLIAHAVFLSVINSLAFQVKFILWKILILVIGNIFVLVLEGLLVLVQTLRLHFYEFFSKFYEGSGIQHKPIFVFNKEMDLNKHGS